MYRYLIKPILFLGDPEWIHYFVFSLIRWIHKIPGVPFLVRAIYQMHHPKLEKELFGIRFKNPVGLAAGFDKDAKLYRELSNFGFGFIEIGTLTPKPQPGNPKKRLFRLPQEKALINRMGFNNKGCLLPFHDSKKTKISLLGATSAKIKLPLTRKLWRTTSTALMHYIPMWITLSLM
jgi:dihydroorotate dehydrogenase